MTAQPQNLDPSFSQTPVNLRGSYGNMMKDVVLEIFKSELYNMVRTYESNGAIMKKFQTKILSKKRLRELATHENVSAQGSGSFYMIDLSTSTRSKTGLKRAEMKKALVIGYRSYIDHLEGDDGFGIGSSSDGMTLDNDADAFGGGFFMLLPLLYMVMLGSYQIVVSVGAEKAKGNPEPETIPFNTSAMTKQNIMKLFASCRDNFNAWLTTYDTTSNNATPLGDPQMNKLLKMLIYYFSIHKFTK